MSATSALAAAPSAIEAEATKAEATKAEASETEVGETEVGETITDTATSTTEPSKTAETTTEAQPSAANERPATEPADSAAIATTPNERDQAVARIRQSALPPALRARLAAVVEAGQSPSLDVAACLEALEETLPDFLQTNRKNVSRPTHPSGDTFFKSDDGELTDAEAETIAQRQLARSGLLRGQRVKVAD